MWVRQPYVERDAAQQGDGRVDPGLAARRPLGGAGRAGRQDHRATVLRGRLQVRRVVGLDELLERRDVVGRRRVVGPAEDPHRDRGLPDEVGELLVVDEHGGLVASEHLDQLRAGEGGVEVERVGPQLGCGDARIDEAAVVAAHDRHPVALPDPELAQRMGQRVRTGVHLAEREAPELVDEPDPAGRSQCQGREPPGRSGPPLAQAVAQARERERRVRTDDPGAGEDLHGGPGRHGAGLQLGEHGGSLRPRTRRRLSRSSSARRVASPTSPCSPSRWSSATTRRSAPPRRCRRRPRRWGARSSA